MNKELLDGQNVTEGASSLVSSELVKQTQVEGTPFVLVESEKETFLALGAYKITLETDGVNDMKSAKSYLKKNMWHMVARVIAVINNDLKELK